MFNSENQNIPTGQTPQSIPSEQPSQFPPYGQPTPPQQPYPGYGQPQPSQSVYPPSEQPVYPQQPTQQPYPGYGQPMSSAPKPRPNIGPPKPKEPAWKNFAVIAAVAVGIYLVYVAIKFVILTVFFAIFNGVADNWGITGIIVVLAILIVIWAIDKFNSSQNRTRK